MEHVIDLPPLCLRADVAVVSDEDRIVELVFSTGAPVERYDYWRGTRYIEKLSLKPGHVRLDRLNAGAPLLDAHSAWSITQQLGVVETDSVKFTAKEARAKVRFSKRAAVTEIWNDVKDRIIRAVSVGYKVYRFEETAGKDGAVPTRLATDWEPCEVSLVPMPADIGSKVRSGKDSGVLNQCVLITRGGAARVPTTADYGRRLRLAQAICSQERQAQ